MAFVLWLLLVTSPSVVQATPAPVTTAPKKDVVSDWLDKALKGAQIAAYLVGGFWVYFKFIKGRTLRPRLEPKVSGELSRSSECEFVKVIIELRNVGLTKVEIRQDGTILRLLTYDDNEPDKWRRVAVIDILVRHQWIEPGELITEPVVQVLSLKGITILKAEVTIAGKKTEWQALAICHEEVCMDVEEMKKQQERDSERIRQLERDRSDRDKLQQNRDDERVRQVQREREERDKKK